MSYFLLTDNESMGQFDNFSNSTYGNLNTRMLSE